MRHSTRRKRQFELKIMVLAFGVALWVCPAVSGPDATGAAVKSPPPVTPSSEMLVALTGEERANAVVTIELFGDAGTAEHDAASQAEQLWSAGAFEAAISTIRQLEDHVGVGIGIAWKVPVPSGSAEDLTDARIGSRDDGGMVALDYDAGTENLFAVVHWTDSAATWTVNISTDGGETWAETYSWGTSGWANAVVADDWLYVSYMYSGDLSQGRIRRFSVADGLVDGVYDFQVVVDTDPATIDEIVPFSDADEADERIYFFLIENDGSLRAFWDESSDGTTFVEDITCPISNAASGLDSHWNARSAMGRLTWHSYLGTDNAIHIWRWDLEGWTEEFNAASYSGSNLKTKISAYTDTVVFCFEEDGPPGWVRFALSRNGGGSWFIGSLSPIADNCFDFDVTGRAGMGIAAIYGCETGTPNDLFFKSKDNYYSAVWTNTERFNDHDFLIGGTDMEINWIGNGYGMVYVAEDGRVWFDRPDLIFTGAFELGDTSTWSATVP